MNIRVCLYLANEDGKANVELFLNGVKSRLKKLENFDGRLTFEQEEGLENLKELLKKWESAFTEVVKIINSDKARMDAYFVKTELSPKLTSISQKIGRFIGNC